MAKQTINIGAAANDGTGDPLRTAFDKINDNTDELYAGQSLSLASDILTLTRADGTTSTVDLTPYLDEDARAIASGTLNGGTGIVTFTRDDASTFTLDLSALLDDTNIITSVNTQTGAVVLDSDDISEGSTNLYNQTHTGDVTGSTALTIANDVVDHDELAARYSDQASIATLTGTVSFDCSTAANFKLSGDLTGAYTIDLSNYKKGQIITIWPLKAQSVTLDAQGSSTNTFYKIGGVDYDNTTSSILQIECVDDSATDPVFFYSIATYASDNTI